MIIWDHTPTKERGLFYRMIKSNNDSKSKYIDYSNYRTSNLALFFCTNNDFGGNILKNLE